LKWERVKRIKLTQGMEALVDDEDFALLGRYKWHAQFGGNGLQYAVSCLGRGKKFICTTALLGSRLVVVFM